jgi:hypothetical protein
MRWLWLGLALAACGTAAEGASTTTSSILSNEAETAETDGGSAGPLASVDESPLAIPGAARRVTYSPDAPFTALIFAAKEGQDLGFLVDTRTAGAKPAVWITDNQFVTIVSKSTASGSAFVRFSPNRTGIYYLVLRERTLQPSTFLVTPFDFTPPGAGTD